MQPVLLLEILTSSLFLILSFPRPDLGWIAFFALVPLFIGVADTSCRRAFLTGWGAGTLWFFVSYNWVSHSLNVFGGITFPFAQAIILLLAGTHGLYVAFFAMLVPLVAGRKEPVIGWVRRGGSVGEWVSGFDGVKHPKSSLKEGPSVFTHLLTHPFAAIIVLPSAWVLLEVARTWFPAPFPWLLMGNAMWKIPLSRPLYEVSGVYGVSFWILSINVLVWMLIRTRGPGRRWVGVALVLWIFLPLALSAVKSPEEGQSITVGVVQGNFRQALKWDENIRQETIATYLSLTDEAVRKGAKLVVWPETAVPEFYQAEPSLRAKLKQFASDRDLHLVFGSPGYETKGADILLYNRVYHLTPDGKEEFYDKNILVPFGEYVPLARLLPFIDKLVPGEGEFSRGVWKGPFQTPVPAGTLICYEISFPSLARREVADGSSILINVTNDAWFGRSWGPYQHLAVSAVRAMENGVPVIRAANTGISAVIDRNGHIIDSIPLDQRGILVATVETGAGLTLYTLLGDWIVIPCAAVVSVYFLLLLITWRPYKWTR